MFDLTPTDDQLAVQRMCQSFAADRLRPSAAEAERNSELTEKIIGELAGLGVTGQVPAEFGGQGLLDAESYLIAVEALAHGDPGLTFAALAQGHAALVIDACGAPEQKSELLPALASGRRTGTLLCREPGGHGAAEPQTQARRSESGWRLDGRKSAVVRPQAADLAVVVAALGQDGLGGFVISGGDRPGVVVTTDHQRTGKLGLLSAPTGDVALQGVDVPADALLDGPNQAAGLLRAVTLADLGLGAVALGAATAALDYATDYARERVAFGRPIIANQGVSFKLVDRIMEVDATRLELRKAAVDLDKLPANAVPEAAALAARVHRSVARCCDLAAAVTREAVNVLGGHGFLTDHPVERWYRDAATLAALTFDPLSVDLHLV